MKAMPTLTLRPISVPEHREFLATRPETSFLQQPEWAQVKPDWTAESLGWFAGDELVGAALVLHRAAPVVKKSLAYIPMGPVIDWTAYSVDEVMAPLAEHLKTRGSFAVRIGPPVDVTEWGAAPVRKALGSDELSTLEELPPVTTHPAGEQLVEELRAAGLRPLSAGMDFHAGQPEYVGRVPLVGQDGSPKTIDQVLKTFSSNTRRETRNTDKADLQVVEGGLEDLHRFQELYRQTAGRQEFTGRPLSYFQTLYRTLNEVRPGACRLYFAEHQGADLATAIMVQYGNQAWYLYGASGSEHRELNGPKALQLRMLTDALAAGCVALDHGGVTPTLSLEGDHHGGLTRFKASVGANIVRTAGEWELALNRPLAWAFNRYMAWRAR